MMAATIHPLFETPLPDRWKLMTVDDIKSIEKSSCVAGPFGSNISSKYFVESGVPVIRGSNLRNDLTRFVPLGFAFVSKEQATKYKAQHVRAGDLIFTCWGTVGQVGIIPDNGPFPEYIISNKQLKLRANDEIADSLYLFYYFAGPKMVHHVLGKAIGAAVPGINLGILKALPVVLPPLLVQRRIAGILSAYDELIENNQRRIRILEDMARSLYREWFVHFRYPGHESVPLTDFPLGPIPQGWDVKRIMAFGKVITGKTPSKANSDFYGEDVPFVKTPDMHGNMFILSTGECLSKAGAGSQANKRIPAGSICVSCIGTIGVVSIMTEDCQTNQQINSIVLEKEYFREFLFFRLQDAKQALENLGSNGATMGNVNKSKFESLEIIAPPEELLERYHQFSASLLSEIFILSRQTSNLRRTRDLLLPRLLSGRVSLVET